MDMLYSDNNIYAKHIVTMIYVHIFMASLFMRTKKIKCPSVT